MKDIKPIRTEADYDAALAALERVFDAAPGSRAADRHEVLATLIEAYEAERHPIPPSDPVAAISFYMEQNGLDSADLGAVIGSRSHASEVLHHKRALSIEMIRRIAGAWPIPAEVLIRPTRSARGADRRRRGRAVRSRAG